VREALTELDGEFCGDDMLESMLASDAVLFPLAMCGEKSIDGSLEFEGDEGAMCSGRCRHVESLSGTPNASRSSGTMGGFST